MIPSLIIGRKGSTGFPNKNVYKVLGRPLMSYPILAAKNSKYVNKNSIYISTDSKAIQNVGVKYGCRPIKRPQYLATNEALAEDAFIHGYDSISEQLSKEIEFIILLFCNGATITPGIIDKGIQKLRENPSYDSACTVSLYNMWSPLRAKKIDNGVLKPFGRISDFSDSTCDRDSQGDTYFADCSAFICRPICLKKHYGDLPFRWIGRKVLPLKQWGGLDLDYKWQLGQLRFWLQAHGFSLKKTPYDKR